MTEPQEPNGNRIEPEPPEVDGNRIVPAGERPPRDVNGNRAPGTQAPPAQPRKRRPRR